MRRVMIGVSPKFAKKLKGKHEWFNQNIAKNYFKKEITFADFTDLLCNGFDEAFDFIFGSKLLLLPIRKGRRSRKVSFEVDSIPI